MESKNNEALQIPGWIIRIVNGSNKKAVENRKYKLKMFVFPAENNINERRNKTK